MKDKQQEILDAAAVLFSAIGIKKTSVDAISSKCGISKKTLYQYFVDKEAIVSEIVKQALIKTRNQLEQPACKTSDAPSELISFFYFIKTGLSVLAPLFISDIVKFYPNINALILQSRTAELLPFFIQNINKGILEGHYRTSIDGKLTAELYFRQLDSILEDSRLKSSDKFEILSYINNFFLYGILNTSGKTVV